MNIFTLNYDLIQHTPMIHFQGKQEEVNLRATEVKSALNRFLKKKLKDEYFNYFNENKPSPYRLIVKSKETKPLELTKITQKLYFADKTEDNPDLHKSLVNLNSVSFLFISKNKKLLEAIKKYFPDMIAVTNFGARNNKGFGSFYINGEDIKEKLKSSGYNIFYFNLVNRSDDNLFLTIYYLYNVLKGGINETNGRDFPEKYQKSLLWKYFNEKISPGFVWEKRFLKSKLPGNYINIEDKKRLFIRILLGYSPVYTFRQGNYRNDIEYGHNLSDVKSVYPKQTFPLQNDNIERLESPIMFKPVKTETGWRVYIILKPELYKNGSLNIFNKDFFIGKSKKDKIKTPTEFDLNKFFEWAIDKINNTPESNDYLFLRTNDILKDLIIQRVE